MATARQRKAAEAKATAKYRDLSNRYDAAGQGRRIKSWKLGLPAPPAPKVAAPAQADPQGDPKADPKADPAQARFEAFMAAQQATNAAILAVLAALKPPEAPCPT